VDRPSSPPPVYERHVGMPRMRGGAQPAKTQDQVLMKLRVECALKFPAVIVSHRQENLDELHFCSVLALCRQKNPRVLGTSSSAQLVMPSESGLC